MITRSCSRTIRRHDVVCQDMRGVQRGIECSCTLDSCNGDDDVMISADYAQLRDQALFGGSDGAVDASVGRKQAAAKKTGSVGAASARPDVTSFVCATCAALLFGGRLRVVV